MWNRFNLRMRIYGILAALVIITLGGGLVMVWYTYQIQCDLDEMTEKSIAPFQAAAELERVRQVRENSTTQAKQLRIIAVSAVFAVLGLGSLLAFILAAQILGPIRRLAIQTEREGPADEPINEVQALSRGVQGLMENIDHRQSELERSQEVLLQTEKLALVGKLAAGTAHSIRNPLTSVKMRLFSLARSLDLDSHQKEDFDVISEAIDHIDTIVENFLGFSKPPKLKKQTIYPSDVIDLSVKLLEHRLRSYQVQLKVKRETMLPDIEADPEQLKEALINIILNACEAMKNGGFIEIREKIRRNASGEAVIIEISDNGPGIPKGIQNEVFQPFFTTKDEGTGLGLSISARIIAQHGGSIDLISEENGGATFVITLPIKENHLEQDSYH
jgi:signal transduction histidine kinase